MLESDTYSFPHGLMPDLVVLRNSSFIKDLHCCQLEIGRQFCIVS